MKNSGTIGVSNCNTKKDSNGKKFSTLKKVMPEVCSKNQY
jgi:hypothetical protein